MRSKRTAFSAMVALCASVGWLASKSDSPLSATALAEKPVIVLVHGAFIDATSFQGLIPLLQQRHYRVIAVQNPLTSFDDDVATTRRLLEAQHGPIVLVGHSYGGAVISAAGSGNSNVKALVYIAAFAPDAGEAIGGLQSKYAPPLLSKALVPDKAGFLYVDTAKFHDVVAQDLPVRLTRVAAVTQKPLINTVFTASSPQAAWRTVPSWYLVATEDHAINPDLERFYAKRMNAQTTEVKSSHVMYISHPADVAKVIEAAATAAAGQPTTTNR